MGLAELIDATLPQTQCTRCGYPSCRRYAEAIAAGEAEINQCPPGGAEGVARLAAVTGRPAQPLNPVHGVEATRGIAVIDEAWCIGCTLCIKACPADCIVGSAKAMHVVVASQCTGCELCVPACPVDCISMPEVTMATGWSAWSQPQADEARERFAFRQLRRHRDAEESDARIAAKPKAADAESAQHAAKRAAIETAVARSRARRAPGSS